MNMKINRKFMIGIGVVGWVYTLSVLALVFSPMDNNRSSFRGNAYGHFALGNNVILHWCQPLHWQKPSGRMIALASHPGSGNTWLRYLLQQATGILTGSIYLDYSLRSHGFPGENVTDGSVLVVKTHEGMPKNAEKFSAALLLVRNPKDALLADFNRLHKGHIGTAPRRVFVSKDIKITWADHVASQSKGWERFHKDWISHFPNPIHFIFYDKLVEDTETTLWEIFKFLNHTVTKEMMQCTINRKEGIYKRRKKYEDFDPFTREMKLTLRRAEERVFTLIYQYMQKTKVLAI